MGFEGIGASVVRKEDRRFIMGKGRYVDDIALAGMATATIFNNSLTFQLTMLAAGAALVGALLWRFNSVGTK